MYDGQEIGKCEVCGKDGSLIRTYFRYNDVKCKCHNDCHFEMVRHHKDCVPKEPTYTKVSFKTEDLKAPIAMAMDMVIKTLREDKTPGSYYYAWQSNIACAIMDNSELSPVKANEIAVKFLEMLIK